MSYYHLFLKGAGVVPTSRDGRELFLLANLIDLLRTGALAQLGDGLAARFLAIQQATLDGQWQAARYLEIFNPEVLTAAGAAMTLAARRHAKIVDKAKGVEPWTRQEGKGKGGKPRGSVGWGQDYYGEGPSPGKGKGKKGKSGGKGYSWTQKNRETWKPKNEWHKDATPPEKGKDDKGRKEGTG